MDKEDKPKMLCLRVSDYVKKPLLPYTTQKCSTCDEDVIVSNASLELAKEHNADLVCSRCLVKEDLGEVNFRGLSESQIEEIKRSVMH